MNFVKGGVGVIVLAVAVFLLAAGMAGLSARSFRQKGFLLNNAWIYASPAEREKMNKAPYYRQSAVVFLLLSLVFLLIGVYALTENALWLWFEGVIMAATFVYAIFSSVHISKKTKRG